MNILLAGGAGFVGCELARSLFNKDKHNFDIIDKLMFDSDGIKKLPWYNKIIRKDLFDLTVEDIKKYDVVVFLGGLSNDPMAEFSPKLNFIENVSCPLYLAYISKQAGVKRFIFASTMSVYGLCNLWTFKKETDECIPTFPYGISKLTAERGVMSLADNNFSVISLRKATIGGVSARMRFDLLLNTMFMRAITLKKVQINNPLIARPIIGMKDVVSAYEIVIDAPFNKSGVYNLAFENYTLSQVAEIVSEFFGNIPIEVKNFKFYGKDDPRSYSVNTNKFRKEFNWKPTESIPKIMEDIETQHSIIKYDFDKDIYHNVEIFKKVL